RSYASADRDLLVGCVPGDLQPTLDRESRLVDDFPCLIHEVRVIEGIAEMVHVVDRSPTGTRRVVEVQGVANPCTGIQLGTRRRIGDLSDLQPVPEGHVGEPAEDICAGFDLGVRPGQPQTQARALAGSERDTEIPRTIQDITLPRRLVVGRIGIDEGFGCSEGAGEGDRERTDLFTLNAALIATGGGTGELLRSSCTFLTAGR